jgi:tetratricopeptide (TPR) repeat protein
MLSATPQIPTALSLPVAGTASRKTLKAAAVFWFVVTFVGQLLFAAAIAFTYGAPAIRGDLSRWNKGTQNAYVPGEHFANAVVVVHILSAFLVILSGSLQLIPALRNRAPRFHRWNGRTYIIFAFSVSLAGIYMILGRGTIGTPSQHIGQLLLAALIMAFAVMAWRTAMARNFSAHRRWALRLYLTVSAALFVRAASFLSLAIPGGIDPVTFAGSWITFLSYGQYLVPLALLELYLRAQTHGSSVLRLATACVLFVFTAGLGLGIAATFAGSWTPKVRAALDSRISIADTLSSTLDAEGVDAALRQYRELKTSAAAHTYNFDEPELNGLGYRLLRKHQFTEAIRVFQLNVQNFPNSGNVYDSLGEAYADIGDKADAITSYRRSLELNPRNSGAVLMLRKLAFP